MKRVCAIMLLLGLVTAAFAQGKDAVIGDGAENTADGDYATVSGGKENTSPGYGTVIGGGIRNQATSRFVTVAGGTYNLGSGDNTTISGGQSNQAAAKSTVIGGGENNKALGSCTVIAGGSKNEATADTSTICGGVENKTEGMGSTVAGGRQNFAGAVCGTVGGGNFNRVETESEYGTVAGGANNRVSQPYATVPGGLYNNANGFASFAAGRKAAANHAGCFVWADAQDRYIESQDRNQFIVRAQGGVWFGDDSYPNFKKDAFIQTTAKNAYLSRETGQWEIPSDRDLKEDFEAVDQKDILDKVAELPITSWRYKGEDASVKHLGPVAQDFHATFDLGSSGTSITPTDLDGVALAAIQALVVELEEADARIAELEERLNALEEK
ncbi:tail fiber domain-containing protein [candidate division WOR-3 bacterium]|nr:tail fiber domain-containing protein [candidate division WOR-3 bacterium]